MAISITELIEKELERGKSSKPSLSHAPLAAQGAEMIGFRRGLQWVLRRVKRHGPLLADVPLPEALYRLRKSGYLGLDVASALLVIHRFREEPQSSDAVDPAAASSHEPSTREEQIGRAAPSGKEPR